MIREKLVQQLIIYSIEFICRDSLDFAHAKIFRRVCPICYSGDDDSERNGKNYAAQRAQERENNRGDINGYLVKALTADRSPIGISPTFVHRCSTCSLRILRTEP